MATSPFQRFSLLFFPLIFFIVANTRGIEAQVEDTAAGLKIFSDALEWPLPMAMYGGFDGGDDDADDIDDSDGGLLDLDGDEGEKGRRSLYWRRFHYYISYGALSANRIPCPPRSGRSYYTHNCYGTHTPVNPYTRGCSMITRCRR